MANYKPFALGCIVTNGCNAGCDICGIKKASKPQRLSVETMKDYINQARDYGIKLVAFTGGEPTMIGEDLFDVIGHAHSKGMICGLTTNASYAKDERTAKEMSKRLSESGLIAMDISFDLSHLKFVPYEYVFNAVKSAIQYNLSPSISATDLRSTFFRNWLALEKMAKDLGGKLVYDSILVNEKKVAHVSQEPVHREGEAKKLDKREFHFRKIKYNESCDEQVVMLRPDGKVTAPCCSFSAATYDFYAMGNADETTLEEVVEKVNKSIIGSVLLSSFGIGRVKTTLAYSKDPEIRRLANRNYSSQCEFCGTVFSDQKAKKFIVDEYERLRDVNPKIVFMPNVLATDELFAKVVHEKDGKKKKTPLIEFLGPLRKEDYDIARFSHDLEILERIKSKGKLKENQEQELSKYINQLKDNIEILQEAKIRN